MEELAGLESTALKTDLAAFATAVRTVAEQHQGQTLELLSILRLLESLHQEIRENFFQESLPDNRQALYALLRDIELSGGWPYIHRMKLQAFLSHLCDKAPEELPTQD